MWSEETIEMLSSWKLRPVRISKTDWEIAPKFSLDLVNGCGCRRGVQSEGKNVVPPIASHLSRMACQRLVHVSQIIVISESVALVGCIRRETASSSSSSFYNPWRSLQAQLVSRQVWLNFHEPLSIAVCHFVTRPCSRCQWRFDCHEPQSFDLSIDPPVYLAVHSIADFET